MANRFWVGGSGTWNNATTTNWSATTGGGGGASVPSTSDAVFFDANSGTGTVTMGTSPACASMDASASTVLTFTGAGLLTCAGSITLKSGLTISGWTGTVTLTGTSTHTITWAGNTAAFSLTQNGAGGTYTLQDKLTLGATNTFTLTQGTFNANGKDVQVGLFNSTNTNTRTLTMGTGLWTLTGNNVFVWTTSNTTGLTFNVGTQNIVSNYSGSVGTRLINPGSLASGQPSFSITAGTDIFAVSSNVMDLDFTGFAGQINPQPLNISGSLKIPAGVTWSATSGNTITFTAASGSKTIDTNNVNIQQVVTIGTGASTATWQLLSDFKMEAARTLTFAIGTLDANGHNVTVGQFNSSNGNTRTILMGTGTWELTATTAATVWNMATVTGLTLTPSTSTIKISGSTASIRTFAGGGKSYNNLLITNATANGEVDFTGSNTFQNLRQTDATAQTIKFTTGTTTTLASATLYGTTGNLLTIGTITAAGHTIAKANGGFVFLDYVSISRSTIGTNQGYIGPNSTNGGNNVGWQFNTNALGGFF